MSSFVKTDGTNPISSSYHPKFIKNSKKWAKYIFKYDKNDQQIYEKVLSVVINSLIKYHLLPIRVALKKPRNDKCW